jgi:hypothetical protein
MEIINYLTLSVGALAGRDYRAEDGALRGNNGMTDFFRVPIWHASNRLSSRRFKRFWGERARPDQARKPAKVAKLQLAGG